MTLGRNLRQVGDADDLTVSCQSAQLVADDLGDATADTHIHFIENQRGDPRLRRGNYLNGQADTGQFAPRRHPLQRTGGLPRIGGHFEADLVAAVYTRRSIGGCVCSVEYSMT